MMKTKTQQIAELNDQVRQRCQIPVFGKQKVPCQILMTQGVAALGPVAQICISAIVRDYDAFTEDNDPHGERDFGAFTYEEGKILEKIFWKIDYYDQALEYGSEDPADPEQTTRVLTIMLASEY